MNILFFITGAGAPGFTATKNSVQALINKYKLNAEIFSWDCKKDIGDFTVPSGNNPGYTKSIKNIIAAFSSSATKIIIPITDPELVPLAKAKQELNDKYNTKVLCSDHKTLLATTCKDRLYSMAEAISPAFAKVNNKTEIDTFLKRNDSKYGFLKIPNSHGSRGTKKIVPLSEYIELFSKLKPQEYGMLFPYEHAEELLKTTNCIITEYLPGKEYSIDCVFDKESNLLFYGVRERFVVDNGISKTVKFVVDQDKKFQKLIEELASCFDFKFNINIQAKLDKENNLKLLEINPRISGSLSSFNSVSDYDFVHMAIINLLYDQCPDTQTPQFYKAKYAQRVTDFKKL